jgi:hypothetical protein
LPPLSDTPGRFDFLVGSNVTLAGTVGHLKSALGGALALASIALRRLVRKR